jgi:DNA-binding MarR family transcriptional regulator
MADDLNRRLEAALRAKWVSRQTMLRKLLKETGPHEVDHPGSHQRRERGYTPEQFAIISILHSYGHGVTVKEVAEAIDIPHANVTRTLDKLERKGIIHRRRGSEDRRQMIVRLTLEGTKAAKRLMEIERHLDEMFWDVYSESEKKFLLNLLCR